MDDDRVLRLLASIDRRLALLTSDQERELWEALEAELRTDARIKMFRAIDGTRTSPDIAKAAGVSKRAAQLFVKELLDRGLVRSKGKGRGRAIVVQRDEDAIIRWYLGEERANV